MKFSIIIVNYNGRKYTERCVDSILNSTNVKQLEIIVVDNGSTDDTAKHLSKKYRNNKIFHLIKLDKNYGPAFARNIGVKNSCGDYIGFLDNDTVVDRKWAQTAGKYFDSHPKTGIIQSKLLLLKEPNKIDYVGEFLGQNGFIVQVCPAGTEDNGQYDNTYEILAAKSAGMFIRRKAFVAAGGFDSDYFIYVEETDLGWRSWLAGYKSLYLPTSIVYHEFGTSTVILGKSKSSYNAKFHGSKNYILSLLKNLELRNVFLILVPHVILWQGLSLYNLFKGQFSSFIWINKGILWNVYNLPRSLGKRRDVQGHRKTSDKVLFSKILRKQNLTYFINKAVIKHKIGNAESF